MTTRNKTKPAKKQQYRADDSDLGDIMTMEWGVHEMAEQLSTLQKRLNLLESKLIRLRSGIASKTK